MNLSLARQLGLFLYFARIVVVGVVVVAAAAAAVFLWPLVGLRLTMVGSDVNKTHRNRCGTKVLLAQEAGASAVSGQPSHSSCSGLAAAPPERFALFSPFLVFSL